MICINCGAHGAPLAKVCSACGGPMLAVTQGGHSEPTYPEQAPHRRRMRPDRLAGRAAPESGFLPLHDDATAALYPEAIGQNNRDDYLERFRAFDAGGSSFGWHWPAFFITFWWLVYRKLWGIAALYIVGGYLFSLALGAIASLAGMSPLASGAISLAVLVVVPAVFANKLYHRMCRKLIERGRAESPDSGVQRSWVARKGGTSVVAAVLVGLLFALIALCSLYFTAWPTYQEYTMRGRSAAAYAFGQKVTGDISERYARSGKYPSKQDMASLTEAAPPEVRLADYNPGTGALQLTLAKAPKEHDTFEFMPYLDDQKRLQWQCRSINMPQRHLPKACWRPVG